MLIWLVILVIVVWLVAVEVRHYGLKTLVADTKALADQAKDGANKALSAVGSKTRIK
jgi:hypothetical protein